jgi:hypothetical protein
MDALSELPCHRFQIHALVASHRFEIDALVSRHEVCGDVLGYERVQALRTLSKTKRLNGSPEPTGENAPVGENPDQFDRAD